MNEYLYLRTSHSNEEFTGRLTEALEEAGYKVWLGQGSADDQQARQTKFAIERSDAILLELSPEAVSESDIVQELAVARAADKPIYLIQLQPVDLPAQWETYLAGQPPVDLGEDFDAGLDRLLQSLAEPGAVAGEDEETGEYFGAEHLGQVLALPGEQIVWSDGGLYWFEKWRTLVRVMVMLTNQRLMFFWDTRDIWKWKPREADELEEAFPMALALDEITAVGKVQRPKSLWLFSTGKPFVEITASGDKLHRFNLDKDFENRIDTLRQAITN